MYPCPSSLSAFLSIVVWLIPGLPDCSSAAFIPFCSPYFPVVYSVGERITL